MLISLVSSYVIAAGLIGSLSPDAAQQLKDYLPGGQFYREGDEIKLLEPNNSTPMMKIENYHNDLSDIGYCFGLTQAQLGLWNIEFAPASSTCPKSSSRDIASAILKASVLGGSRQKICGYSKDEINSMLDPVRFNSPNNPIKTAVAEIQMYSEISLKTDGSLSLQQKINPWAKPAAPKFNETEMKIQNQTKEFINSIDKGVPAFASEFFVKNHEIDATGHAMIVMGYIQNKDPSKPPRLIVQDTNSPKKMRVIESKFENNQVTWMDLNQKQSMQPIVFGTQSLSADQEKSLAQQFTKNSLEVNSPEPEFTHAGNKNAVIPNHRQCGITSIVDKIFSHAQKN